MEAAGAARAKAETKANGTTDRQGPPEGRVAAQEPSPRRSFYGLPCANCGTYYDSDLSVCPICKSSERVSPTTTAKPTISATAPIVDPEIAALEKEREQFLKEFKAQMFAAHTQINMSPGLSCDLEQNHPENSEPACICRPCYDRLQGKADRMEAALHIDLKEAAQIVYEAVWADSSDPSKTYANAAQALLTELRKRAGLSTILTTLQPYAN
jgi:hypothetical protein